MKNKRTYNTLALVLGKTVQTGIGMGISLLTARYLGPGEYGLLQYAAAYAGFFMALCTLGLPEVLVKALTDRPEAEGQTLGSAFALQTGAGLLAAAGMVAAAYFLDRGNGRVLRMVLLSGVGMCLQGSQVLREWLRSRMQFGILTGITTAACLVCGAYKLWLMGKGGSAEGFALSTAVEAGVQLVLFLAAYQRLRGDKWKISRERAWALLEKSRHFILPGVMVAVYAQTDKLMLGRLLGQAETGYYSCAVSVCSCWCFVLAAVIDAAGPEITRLHKQDRREFLQANQRLYREIFYLAAAVSAMICIGAEPLIRLLYGGEYLRAVPPLRVITWYTGFSYLGVARNIWIVCENRQKALIWVYLAAALSNVGLNLLLIPRWGATGAAAASLASQVITTLVVPFFLGGLRENSVMMLRAVMPFGPRKWGRK